MTEGEEDDELEETALEPGCDTQEREFDEKFVAYEARGPRDVVVSGPVIGGWGPGKWFKNRRQAYVWARTKYGPERVQNVRQTRGRWAFLIKNLRSE